MTTRTHDNGEDALEVSSSREAQLLAEANALCHGTFTLTRENSVRLYLAGRLAARTRPDDSSIAYMKLGIALGRPRDAKAYVALGDALLRRSPHEAIAAYLCALVRDKKSPVPYTRLGSALVQAGLLFEAVAAYREAIRLRPRQTDIHWKLGDILDRLSHTTASLSCFEEAVKHAPSDPDGYIRLGVAQLTHGHCERALHCFRHAHSLTLFESAVHASPVTSTVDESPDDGVEAFRWALTRPPGDIHALSLLADLFNSLDRPREASEVWLALGNIFLQEKRYGEASRAYRRVAAEQPSCLRAILGAARACLLAGLPNQAIPLLRQAVAQQPDHASARAGLGEALHLTGEVDEGWDMLAPYYLQGAMARPFEQPLWDGSRLDGKTILLWSGNGRGDVIQFLRYARFAHDAGGRVIVECHHKGLLPLIERMTWVDEVLAHGVPLPAFDVHAPLMCLPALVRPSRAFSSEFPYLSVDPDRVAIWRERLREVATGRTVGLSWGGAVAHEDADSRFLPLSSFRPLTSVTGVQLVNLQHGPQTAELLNLPDVRLLRLSGEQFSIVDVAALILSLDLVITVDTMIAHLAGALGRPVWTLLRFASNWRWQMKGDRTPWYPTMRFFRQSQPGNWVSVMGHVRHALEAYDWTGGQHNERSSH